MRKGDQGRRREREGEGKIITVSSKGANDYEEQREESDGGAAGKN